MTSISCNRLVKIYLNDIKNELNFLFDEILHIAYIYNFFSVKKGEGDEENRVESHSLRNFFRTINPILREISEDLIDMYVDYREAEQLLQTDFSASKETKEVLVKRNIDFFQLINNYIRTKEKLLEKLVFLQRKIISILDSFPFYYPSPKVSSIKEASKIHLFIELLAQDIYDVLTREFHLPEREEKLHKSTYFYWDYDPELRFLEKSDLFIFNSNFFLPEKQSYWMILFHEVFHFILNKAKVRELSSENKSNEKGRKFVDTLLKYIDRCIETLYFRFPVIGTKTTIGKDVITDIFIDSMLTYMFGEAFFIPAFSNIFLFDEGSFLLPRANRTWYIRLRVLTDVLERFHGESSSRGKCTKDVALSCKEILEEYRKAQYETRYVRLTLFSHMEKIIKVIEEFCMDFIARYKDYLNKLKKDIESKEWVKTYLDAQINFIRSKWKNPYQHVEGRIFCYKLHQQLIGSIDSDEKRLQVINLKYIKCRYDTGKNLCHYKDTFHALSYGVYTGLYIDENFNQKINKMKDKCSIYEVFYSLHRLDLIGDNSLKHLTVVSTETESNPEDRYPDIELELIESEVLFYKKDYVLTYITGDELDLTSKESKIYILVKSLINSIPLKRQGRNPYEEVIELFKKPLDDESKIAGHPAKVHHFISFDWFDLATLIVLEPNGSEINLYDVLKELKCKVLINNKKGEGETDVPLLLRTETDIFIGNDILSQVEVPMGSIHLRVSSEYLGETNEQLAKIEDIMEKATNGINLGTWEIALRFGIRDLMLVPKKRENGGTWKFKHILSRICDVLNMKNNKLFSDFQFVVGVVAECDVKNHKDR